MAAVEGEVAWNAWEPEELMKRLKCQAEELGLYSEDSEEPWKA